MRKVAIAKLEAEAQKAWDTFACSLNNVDRYGRIAETLRRDLDEKEAQWRKAKAVLGKAIAKKQKAKKGKKR